jgi:hypothetical protein
MLAVFLQCEMSRIGPSETSRDVRVESAIGS